MTCASCANRHRAQAQQARRRVGDGQLHDREQGHALPCANCARRSRTTQHLRDLRRLELSVTHEAAWRAIETPPRGSVPRPGSSRANGNHTEPLGTLLPRSGAGVRDRGRHGHRRRSGRLESREHSFVRCSPCASFVATTSDPPPRGGRRSPNTRTEPLASCESCCQPFGGVRAGRGGAGAGVGASAPGVEGGTRAAGD
jgi:hypothetical protein